MGRYAYNCLLARRLAERGVRFIQLYHRGWDAHNNAPKQVPAQCRDTDQPTAALLLDTALRDSGSPAFTLGMVPLSTHAPLSDTTPSLLVRALLTWTRAHATRFYNFGGLERFKAKFVPDRWRPLHLVTAGRPITVFTFHDVAAAFAAPRAPTRFVGRALLDAAVQEAHDATEAARDRLSSR